MTEPPVVEPSADSRRQSSPDTSGVAGPSSSRSSFEEIQRTPQESTASSIQPLASDDSASQVSAASDGDGSAPSEAAAEQPEPSQPSQPRSVRRYTPTGLTTTLRRRFTHQTSSTQQPQDPPDNGTSDPSTASKAWDFFVQKLVPIAGFLGLVLTCAFGIGAWAGMNYANSYSKKQYDIALFGACHDYEDMRATPFCQKIITAGMNSADLVKRVKRQNCDCPATQQAVDDAAWQVVYDAAHGIWASFAHRVEKTHMFYVFWTFPMSIQNGGDFPKSDGFGYFILASWRISLYVVWQILLLGASRFALFICVQQAGALLVKLLPELPIMEAWIVPLLSFDAVYVLGTQAPAHWTATFWVLLGLAALGMLCWAGCEEDTRERIRTFIREPSSRLAAFRAIGVIWLLLNLFPCWLMRAARVVTLCLWSLGTYAVWAGWAEHDKWSLSTFAGIFGVLLGTFLDFFQPNLITFLFYKAYGQ
ncbi:hypothetical protein BJY01DRAFT_157318 [Aspergillus pseudoustus]|uniref:Transmembrane protein n=1 Tax=Aspergillus pseudoustus TaxID=1810923 RepID=A0ABR4ICQ2_9EURO